jgi:hypothetical protein
MIELVVKQFSDIGNILESGVQGRHSIHKLLIHPLLHRNYARDADGAKEGVQPEHPTAACEN